MKKKTQTVSRRQSVNAPKTPCLRRCNKECNKGKVSGSRLSLFSGHFLGVFWEDSIQEQTNKMIEQAWSVGILAALTEVNWIPDIVALIEEAKSNTTLQIKNRKFLDHSCIQKLSAQRS